MLPEIRISFCRDQNQCLNEDVIDMDSLHTKYNYEL